VSVFAKGVLATIFVTGMLFGMVYLLLSMILGAKLAYFVEGSITFGVISIMSFIWVVSALGPVGPATAWQAIGIGPNLSQVSFAGTTYNISDYPQAPPWSTPKVGGYIADLHSADDTATELLAVKTVMDSALGDALSTTPGIKATVNPYIKGSIQLTTGGFTETNILMKAATVKGKDSVIAEGKGVPDKSISVQSLPGQTGTSQQATIVKYLVNVGDTIQAGQAVMAISNNGQNGQLTASQGGIVAELGPDVGSLIRPGVPILTLDVEGQAGQPPPVEIVAVRVRGALRTPATIALIVALFLLAVHLLGLSRLEKGRKQRSLAGQSI
jgi:biotin carboxyl carrier protein